MQRKKILLRIACSLFGILAVGSLLTAKLSAQGAATKKLITPVEIVAPSQPFQAALQVQGRAVGFSVGPA
jgi:hypothetical protein